MSKVCALCEHFTLSDADGKRLPQAEMGMGRCKGFDGYVAPVEPYVRWDAKYCVLFGKAKDQGTRMRFIESQTEKEKL